MACFWIAGNFIVVVPGADFVFYTVVFMLLFQLCEEHFLPSGLVTPTRYTDEATGRVIEVLLKPTRLNPGAIPSIFRNCPAYLSGPETVVRESPKEKRTPFKLRGTAGGNTAANLTT